MVPTRVSLTSLRSPVEDTEPYCRIWREIIAFRSSLLDPKADLRFKCTACTTFRSGKEKSDVSQENF